MLKILKREERVIFEILIYIKKYCTAYELLKTVLTDLKIIDFLGQFSIKKNNILLA